RCMVSCTVPFGVHDPRFAECVRENSRYVNTTYPFASAVTVRGNGCRYPHDLGSRFRVQASCLLPINPVSLLALPEPKKAAVTSLVPLPATASETNGHTTAEASQTPGKGRARKSRVTAPAPTAGTPAASVSRRRSRTQTAPKTTH